MYAGRWHGFHRPSLGISPFHRRHFPESKQSALRVSQIPATPNELECFFLSIGYPSNTMLYVISDWPYVVVPGRDGAAPYASVPYICCYCVCRSAHKTRPVKKEQVGRRDSCEWISFRPLFIPLVINQSWFFINRAQ